CSSTGSTIHASSIYSSSSDRCLGVDDMAIPGPCRKLQNQVDSLQTQLMTAQKNLVQTKSNYWVGEVKDLLQQLHKAQAQLADCIEKTSGDPVTEPQPYSDIPFVNPCLKEKQHQDAIAKQLLDAQAQFASSHHDPYWLDQVKTLLKAKK